MTLIALLAIGLYSTFALILGVIGTLVFLAGIITGAQRFVTIGLAVLLSGGIIVGLQGTPVEFVLVATIAIVVAWDTGSYSISLGEQLGRAADTREIETWHALATMFVGVIVASVSYGVYWVAAGGQPLMSLVFLLFAVILLTWALS